MAGSTVTARASALAVAAGAAVAILVPPHAGAVPGGGDSPSALFERMGTGRATAVRLSAARRVLRDVADHEALLVRVAIGVVGALRDQHAEEELGAVVAGGPGTGLSLDDHTRMAAANALGRIGGTILGDAVAEDEPRRGDRCGLRDGAGRARAPRAGDDAAEGEGADSGRAFCFRGLEDETVDVLLACAVPGDVRRVRAACIQALGRSRADAAVETLEAITADPAEDAFVVLAALRALSQILENNHVTDEAVDAAVLEALRHVGVAP